MPETVQEELWSISVVITCYNDEAVIGRAIDSVLNQTKISRIIEILVVDDGSKDNSKEVILQKITTSSRIEYIYQENKGVSGARNAGIRIAKGDYIAFLDSDDAWMPTKIEKVAKYLGKYEKVGVFYSNFYKSDSKSDKLTPIYPVVYQHHEPRLLFKLTAKGGPVLPSAAVVKKSCFEEVGYFDETLRRGGEDIDMWLRIARRYSFEHINDFLLTKYAMEGSLGANTVENAHGYRIALDKILEVEPSVAPYYHQRLALIFYKEALFYYESKKFQEAVNSCMSSFRKNPYLLKSYALLFFIIFNKITKIDLIKSIK